jgi:hypothetical protein
VGTLLPRVRRALRLEADLFEEVEHDQSAGGQALIIVLGASLAGGIGNILAAAALGLHQLGAASLVILAAAFLVAWLAWAFVTMTVGTLLFGGVADMGELQRTLGFAAAPGLLMLVPGVGAIIGIPWSLVAMVIAVRQALDFTTRRALATVGVGSLVMAIAVLPPIVLIAALL